MLERWGLLSDLSEGYEHFLMTALFCSARLFAAFSVLQPTSEQALQGRVRSGIVVLIAMFIAAGQPDKIAEQLTGGFAIALALKEALLGILIGYMAATVFWAAESVGALIDNVAGYNSVQQQNPLSSSQSTPISNILLQLCVTLFYTLGGFLFFLEALFETYKWWPVYSLSPVPVAILERFVILQTDTLMTQVLKIASPVLIIMILIDLGFGLIGKTASKLEPNSLAQPVKSATAVLLVMLSLGVFVQQLTVNISLAELKQQLEAWNFIGKSRS